MATKKTAKSTARRANKSKAARPSKATGEGYKGHRPGTMKEKLHQMFDKLGDEKAMVAAKKLKGVELSTIRTSFSQFRKAAGKSKRKSA